MASEEKNERGCLFYLGIAALLLAVLGALFMVSIGLMMKKSVDKFTDTKPIEFIDQPIDPDYIEAVKLKVKLFSDAVKNGVDEIEISLNEDEINTLIRTHGSLSILKDMVRITLQDQKLKGEVSLPLKKLKTGILNDRYINGMAEFKLAHENDKLNIHLESLKIKDQDIPAQFMANLSQVNFANEISKNPKANNAMKYILGINVEDDNLIIKAGKRN